MRQPVICSISDNRAGQAGTPAGLIFGPWNEISDVSSELVNFQKLQPTRKKTWFRVKSLRALPETRWV